MHIKNLAHKVAGLYTWKTFIQPLDVYVCLSLPSWTGNFPKLHNIDNFEFA